LRIICEFQARIQQKHRADSLNAEAGFFVEKGWNRATEHMLNDGGDCDFLLDPNGAAHGGPAVRARNLAALMHDADKALGIVQRLKNVVAKGLNSGLILRKVRDDIWVDLANQGGDGFPSFRSLPVYWPQLINMIGFALI
jgi:hypothetical protein